VVAAMSSAKASGPTAKSKQATPRGFWRFVGSAAFLGALGTALVSLVQYISAYHDNVAKLAKQDLDAATSALTEAVTALSNPLSLQERLIWNYHLAKKNNNEDDDDAYETQNARSIHKNYEDSFTSLTTGINLLSRKMEIYLDLPGDLAYAAANNNWANVEPISAANLRAFDFGCDKEIPAFGKDKSGKDLSTLALMLGDGSNKSLSINWKSTKDNLLTLEYCFEFTHEHMGGIRHWAARSSDKAQVAKSIKSSEVDIDRLRILAKIQEQRFHYFMSVATFKIEQFRVRYQPNGLLCTVLGIDTALDHFAHVCTPRLVAAQ
jgi:hypothetical protein